MGLKTLERGCSLGCKRVCVPLGEHLGDLEKLLGERGQRAGYQSLLRA